MRIEDLAKIYGNSISKMGKDANVKVSQELHRFQSLILENNDLENLLYLDIFSTLEKMEVVTELFKKFELSPLIKSFIYFLIEEKRISLFPFIYKEITILEDHEMGFLRGFIEGPHSSISENDRAIIENYLKEKLSSKLKLEYIQNADLIGGYKIKVDDLFLDATIDRQFDELKHSILGE